LVESVNWQALLVKDLAYKCNVQFQKISILPHRRDGNFLGEGGSLRPKNLIKSYYRELNWNFQRGGEVSGKIPSVGEVWIFCGTTQCHELYNYFVCRYELCPAQALRAHGEDRHSLWIGMCMSFSENVEEI